MLAIVDKVIGHCAVAACALLTASSMALAQPAPTETQPPAPPQKQQAPAAQPADPTLGPPKDQDRIHEQTPLGEEQLTEILAPIALYPDNLLAQVLTASTYPLEVVMAARWATANPGVKGDALDQAMQKQPWDASVKGLTAVPQVLAMMSDKLDWMEQLGEAYLVQPDDVTKTIQKLRMRAESTGNLKSSKEMVVKKVKAKAPPPPPPREPAPAPAVVAEEPDYIAIEPAAPDVVYVPVYDPVVVYGAWPYPAYRPFYWRPPGYVYAGAFGFGAAFVVGPALWYHYDWRHRSVWIDVRRYNRFNHTHLAARGGLLRWHFNPRHRGLAPFKNVTLRTRYSKAATGHSVAPKTHAAPKGATGTSTAKSQVKPKSTTAKTTNPAHTPKAAPKAAPKPAHTRKPLPKSSAYNERAHQATTANSSRSLAPGTARTQSAGHQAGRSGGRAAPSGHNGNRRHP